MSDQLLLTTEGTLRRIVKEAVENAFVLYAQRLESKQEKEWLTNDEVIDLLSLSKATLQRWRKAGTLRYSKIGGTLYYRRDDINDALTSRLSAGKPE